MVAPLRLLTLNALRLLGDRFWITALVLMGVALVIPGNWSWLKPVVPCCLGGILFFAGLRLGLGEIAASVRSRHSIGVVVVLAVIKLVLLPLCAWALCRVIAPEWALGIFLITAMPSGFSSIALTGLYGGGRMDAVVLVALTSLLVPLSVPLFLAWLTPDAVPPWRAVVSQSSYLLLLLFSPFIMAQLVKRSAPAFVQRHDRWWGPCAIACSVTLVFVGVAGNRGTWASWSWVALLLPAALSCIPVAVAIVGARIVSRWLPHAQATSFAVGAIYVNNGLAVAFATAYFHDQPAILLPSLLVQVPMVLATAGMPWIVPKPPTT